MPKMLIVDDDIHLRKLVLTYAQLDHYQCQEAESGSQALAKLREDGVDIIILDVMMPEQDGFETLAELRKFTQTPVILLTARGEEYDKLLGFNLGADDYVSKPFSPKELMARVGAVLKRSGGRNWKNELIFDGLMIEPDARTTRVDGKDVRLPPKEFDLLLQLAENEHIVFSREQLLDRVWGFDYLGDARTVDTHIKSLREHLGPYRKLIKTVWGVGYKFEYRKEN
ncbi:MAG: response regulator transcription factor [Oscillospiraceae bacterium]|nr:response regulator transcription factor [Oscillospiraceae bacterium]